MPHVASCYTICSFTRTHCSRAWLACGPRLRYSFDPIGSMQVLASGLENVAPSAGSMEPPAKQARLHATESFRVQRIREDATLPKRGSSKAAGYDISSVEDITIPAHGKACVHTGLKIAVPPGTYGRVAPRSGLAVKHFIDTGAGVIDEDYRGELMVLLFNHADSEFQVKKGDRIAQLVLERIATPDVEEVESLDDTERGAGGFGSTGGFGAASAKQ